MKLNRDEFLETGYLIVKEAVPRDKLESVRQAYETLVNRQRENWKAERGESDPPGGVWETSPQPRLQLSRSPLVNQIDRETAPAVEMWLEENIHGVSTELLQYSGRGRLRNDDDVQSRQRSRPGKVAPRSPPDRHRAASGLYRRPPRRRPALRPMEHLALTTTASFGWCRAAICG